MDDVAGEDVDADVLEEGVDVDEVVGGVADVEARLGEADDVDVAVDIGRGECLDGTEDEPDFPFIREVVGVGAVAGRDPNDLTLSFLTTGVAVGDDETGAKASSIEPKFKEDPCLAEPTLPRGTVTPSFIDTPWPNALGRRECEALMD